MKTVVLSALLMLVLTATISCSVRPTNLHPIGGTNEELEMFKDGSPD